jgi:hypothetical protein
MNRAFLDYFRCPEQFAEVGVCGALSEDSGFFRFGDSAICFGQSAGGRPSKQLTHTLPDVSQAVGFEGGRLCLPFDLFQVVENLRYERYSLNSRHSFQRITWGRASRAMYYLVRPLLPVPVRKHLQKAYLRGWEKIFFPHWPVDFTVESLMERLLGLILKYRRIERIPFIWFWPDGARSSVMMTHDVEAASGRDLCGQLMDLDDSFGIKSAFQLIPEERYKIWEEFLSSFRARGFEVNVHDFSHDGRLFQEKQEFLRRAAQINQYLKKMKTQGFRSGALYRNQEWYDAFECSYDMSVPNVAHLEPQRGGCCTVMPYFIGKILELPLTTVQDYTLFHILGDYSIDLWKQQIALILQRNGLISFIVHPDYAMEKRARDVYSELLAYLARLRKERSLWIALPAEIDRWWRNRNEMKLIPDGDTWRIEGPDKARARIAYASLEGDRLVYTLDGAPEDREIGGVSSR